MHGSEKEIYQTKAIGATSRAGQINVASQSNRSMPLFWGVIAKRRVYDLLSAQQESWNWDM